jgi:hypothetical protein
MRPIQVLQSAAATLPLHSVQDNLHCQKWHTILFRRRTEEQIITRVITLVSHGCSVPAMDGDGDDGPHTTVAGSAVSAQLDRALMGSWSPSCPPVPNAGHCCS